MLYKILITKSAQKDISQLTPKDKTKLKNILSELISENPFLGKKLSGNLKGYYSYRLNLKDRIIYRIDKENNIIYINRAKTHYGE